MKLAKIILPLMDNQHRDLFMVHQDLKHELLTTWGGYTSHSADGAWCDAEKVYAERVVVYEIAMEQGDVLKLREIARRICKTAKQQSVMIVTPNGEVDFVHPEISGIEKVARGMAGLTSPAD